MRPESAKLIGKALLQRLYREADAGPPLDGNGGLTAEVAEALRDEFAASPGADAPGGAARVGRGEMSYWRDHAMLTGRLMVEIANRWGGEPDLYRRVGELHDVDYLAFPHDGPGDGPKHPVPLVSALRERGVHPEICCAILEHAPYLEADRNPSSRLSAALSAAEDMATLAALRPPPETIYRLSEAGRELFATVKPLEWIDRKRPVRVERNVGRYINAPLALVTIKGVFRYHV